MFLNKNKVMILIFSFFLISFLSCSSDDSVYTGDGNVVDLDEQEWENDRDSQERPDVPGPGGGGIKYDKDNENSDDLEVDDENPDEVNIIPDDSNDEENKDLYEKEPDVSKCSSGEVSNYEKSKVLARVNYIRSLHNLKPVTYNYDDDKYTAQCSLIIAANKKLDHFPDSSWKCYSADGREGCSKSNIYIRFGMINQLESESVVDAFMTDEGVPSLGHRRWLIDPWLDHISFGRVDDYSSQTVGSAIKVNNDGKEQNISDSDINFVAYPFESYPAELYNDEVMMSFTLISNRNVKWSNNNVKFSGAAVSIKDPSNNVMKINGIFFDNDGYGVPNNLRWFVSGIKKNVRYDVVITNVIVNSVSKDYSYWFELK